MKNKIIASGLAGLALLGGTVAFAVSGSSPAGAASSAQSTLTQNASTGGVRGWLGHHRKELRKEAIESAAKTIGIPVSELRADLKAGQSVADVATAHNVDPQKVVDAWVAGADAKIDQAVKDGKLTQARADKLEAKVPAIAARLVNAHRGDHQVASN